MIPTPDSVAIAILEADAYLAGMHGGRVSTDLQPGGPAIRVTLMPGPVTATTWEWRGHVQVECWADDQVDAAAMAAAVRGRWPGQRLTAGGAFVSWTWIVTEPMAMPDPQTGKPRYLLTVGLAVHEPTAATAHG